MTFFNLLPNKVLIKNTITSILTTILYSVCTKRAKNEKQIK